MEEVEVGAEVASAAGAEAEASKPMQDVGYSCGAGLSSHTSIRRWQTCGQPAAELSSRPKKKRIDVAKHQLCAISRPFSQGHLRGLQPVTAMFEIPTGVALDGLRLNAGQQRLGTSRSLHEA